MLPGGGWRRVAQLPATMLLQRAAASSSGASVVSSANSMTDEFPDHTDYLARILNARVYELAIETPLQPAPCMSKTIHNNVLFKVRRISG